MKSMHRRTFLQSSIAAATASAFSAPALSAQRTVEPDRLDAALHPDEIIDTNVYLGQWPFSRSPFDEPQRLADKLRSHGVKQAWVGSYEGVFQKDISALNERLLRRCEPHGNLFVPFGSVHPKLPGWERDLQRCAEDFHMPGIRLHPAYHNYSLDDPVVAALLQQAAEMNLLVQVACWMEDERTQNPRMMVPAVDPLPLVDLMAATADVHVMLLSAVSGPRTAILTHLAQTPRLSVDTAVLEQIDPLGAVLRIVPAERIVFGSYSPYFYLEANLLKFAESPLTPDQARAIRCDNARSLLPGRKG